MKTTLKLVFIYIGYQLLFGATITAANSIWAIDSLTQIGLALLLSGVAMITHLFVFNYITIHQTIRSVSMNIMLSSLGFTVGAILCCNVLSECISLPNWLENDFTALSHSLLGIVCMTLIAPFMEELLFRGAIMQNLSNQGNSPWRAIIMSASIFGLIHINPAQVFFAFLMGIIFGWVTWRTHSLLPAIAGHVLNNSLSVIEINIQSGGKVLYDHQSVITLTTMMISGLALMILMGNLLKRLTQENHIITQNK